MFRKMNIRNKIQTGFGALLLLMLGVGIFGILGVVNLNSEANGMYNGPTKGIHYSNKMQSTIYAMQGQYLNLLLTMDDGGDVTAGVNAIEELEDEFDGYFTNYMGTYTQGDGTQADLVENLREAFYEVLLPIGDEMQTAATAGDRDKVESLYREMETHNQAVIATAEALVASNQERAIATAEQTDTVASGLSTLLIIIMVVAFAVSAVLGISIANMISRPTRKLVEAANAIAEGDVDIHLDIKSKDEIGTLADAFGRMAAGFKEQAGVLQRIAEGDYTVEIAQRSGKDVVNRAIITMLDNNNQLVSGIRNASSEVSSASQQISQGAQNLASGSTQQAATIEEFSAAISEVQMQSEENTRMAQEVFDDTQQAGQYMSASMESMGRMTAAMQEIDESSKSIAKVIKVIDDIAFQTNILALNAAVEAARAGQHGKGFAVVADEVRNLASKSATAAKETAALIENSTQKVAEGSGIVTTTYESLEKVAELAGNNATAMSKINESSQRQSVAINEITEGINQLSSVVQQNSATAEESAASAEEMSAQASMLTDMVAQFRLRDAMAGLNAPAQRVQIAAPAPQAEVGGLPPADGDYLF